MKCPTLFSQHFVGSVKHFSVIACCIFFGRNWRAEHLSCAAELCSLQVVLCSFHQFSVFIYGSLCFYMDLCGSLFLHGSLFLYGSLFFYGTLCFTSLLRLCSQTTVQSSFLFCYSSCCSECVCACVYGFSVISVCCVYSELCGQ